jgi:cell division protein FtsB
VRGANASRMATSRIRWDRVGRWALICVFAFVLYLYIGPARTWVTTYGEAKRKRAEVAQARAQNEKLRARKAQLKRADAVELEARRIGMVKAGEKLYIVR